MQKWQRRSMCAALAMCGWALCTPHALAQTDYPSKPIKIIVPFPPGGSTDVLMRQVAPRLSQAVGQPVVIENKSGASATLGADFVAKSASDGYTLLVGMLHHTVAQAVFPKLPYHIDKDLVSVGTMAIIPNIVVVNANVPSKTVAELVALSKQQPDQYNYGSAGPGSAHHLIGEVFKLTTGAQLTHVPYRGSAPAVADLLGGQVAVMFDTAPSALPHFKSGKTHPLAVTTAQRSSALPDVPTLAEAGVPGIDIGTWYGLMAPKGTPAPIIARLNREVMQIMNDPAVRQQLQSQGIEPLTSTPEAMQQRIQKEVVEFAAKAQQAQMRIE